MVTILQTAVTEVVSDAVIIAAAAVIVFSAIVAVAVAAVLVKTVKTQVKIALAGRNTSSYNSGTIITTTHDSSGSGNGSSRNRRSSHCKPVRRK